MTKFILAMAVPAMFLLVSCDKEKVVNNDDLPATATSFITTHYPAQAIRQVVKERDDLKTEYHVYLDNNTKLEFSKDGEIREIEGTERIPDAILSPLIVSYVTNNYAPAFIRGWDPESTNQEIKLSNGVELLFDNNGNFLRIDN